MSQTINLPALGESVTEGTVTRWLVSVGDTVTVDQPIVEISTDKVDTEIPSPIAGVIEEILVHEDQDAEVGAPLVRIGGGNTISRPSARNSEAQIAGGSPEKKQEPTQGSSAPSAPSSPAAGKDVVLPELGESVTEGTVTRWLVSVGDTVTVDQPIVEISTDKVDTEIPSPIAGVVEQIRVGEDETVQVGAQLAVIGSADASGKGERRDTPSPRTESAHGAHRPAADSSRKEPAVNTTASGSDLHSGSYVTPLVRRLASQHNVDLTTVRGTGVGGRIRKQDILAAAEASSNSNSIQAPPARPVPAPKHAPPAPPNPIPSAPPQQRPSSSPADKKQSSAPMKTATAPEGAVADKLRGTTEKAPRIRQTIAKRMRESLNVSAQLTQVVEVDMTKIAKLRDEAKVRFQKSEGVKLTFLPFFAKAVTEALKQHPKLNASYDEERQEITYHDAEHLAVAVDTPRGLLVPVISNTGELNLAGIAHKIADIAERTRKGNIGPDELSGGTFTLTNFGSTGALFDTPIINQPQSAILGTGAIVKRPVVISENNEDTIAIRSMVYLSLTYDHRLIDGADAGRFLQTIKARLEAGRFENEIGL